ncbi:hypothetical protein PRIC1_011793 [Phytophthora ramorum]
MPVRILRSATNIADSFLFSRKMRLSQVLLAAAVALLASSNDIASATKTEVSTNAAAVTAKAARTLMSFEEINLNQDLVVSNEEERAGGTVGAAAARAGAGDNTGFHDRHQGDGEQVTVTTYHNNGLFQQLQKWWKRTFQGESESSTKTQRLRHDTKTQES